MGTHSRSPFPDETITEGGSAQNETDDMAVLTEALERLESARPMNRSEWRRAS
jgi:hypothetical protein